MASTTLTQALELLKDKKWVTVTGDLLRGKYVFWIGSGVSRERFPDLAELLRTLFDKLYHSANPTDRNCPYRETLKKIVDMTTINDIDYSILPVNWSSLNDLID